VARLPTRNSFFRAIWQADSYVSSGLFETWDFIKRCHSAYSAWLYRYFRLSGPKRWFIDLVDDGVIFGVIIAFGLVAYALPPNSLTSGDVWNKRREYAVTFTDANGEVIGQRGIRQDDAIPLEEIPPHLIQAVLATEDVRFFDHFGVDILGTFRAAMRNAKNGGPPQGGSSITQQVAKNLFLSPEQTLRRKVHEAFLSLWIEARLPKEDILKLYLDRSYLGGGAYGVEAASQFYFGKSVRDISLAEAAMLAGLFKAPTSYAPHQNPAASRARSNVVLWRMLDAGFITQGELLEARRAPVQIVAKKDADAPDWYLDWAYEDTLNVIKTYNLRGAYVIEVKTPIDRKLQREMARIVNETVDTEGPAGRFTQASAVTMAPDGAVKAIVGGRNYEDSQFNRATGAKRPSGSAFKPFVYLAALLNGYKPTDIVVDGPVSIGNWSPGNYNDSYKGRVTLTTALAKSLNSVPVKLSIDIGRKSIIETAHKVGIKGELETWAPMVLGTSVLTLLDLTTGYATFAGGGKLAKPYAVLEIRKPNGDVIYSRSANSNPAPQVVPEENIADLNSMLAQVVKAGTARKADLGFAPQGGKTGTNQSYRDAWYIGFTAHNVTGVWVGNDDYSPMNEVTGGRIPAPAWKKIMEVAEAGLAPESVAGIPLDDTYTAVAAAEPLDGVPIADETPGAVDVAVGGETRDILDDISSLFQKEQRVLTAPESAASTSLYGDDGDGLVLPKANVRKKSKGDFLDSLFKPKKKKKKRKKFFSF
jgi:penicillin-binding protein 1A